jgi:chitinase
VRHESVLFCYRVVRRTFFLSRPLQCAALTRLQQTTEVYCGNADPKWLTLPCQKGFGSCAITAPPSCGQGSGSTGGRTIGYYQASNTRDRLCNKISPSQIQLAGYTHLYFAFAAIDPNSYAIVPADPADEPLMPQFTALRSKGVQTWIAVGGYDFSDPNKATHRTWLGPVEWTDFSRRSY